MTRGYRPVVAIGEAQRKASAWGLCVITVEAETRLPFDFVIDCRGRTSLVRVRRLKYAGYGTAGIERTCRQQLAELRQLPDLGSITSELWVRGPDRSWHRYRVRKDSLELYGDNGISGTENKSATDNAARPVPGHGIPGDIPRQEEGDTIVKEIHSSVLKIS